MLHIAIDLWLTVSSFRDNCDIICVIGFNIWRLCNFSLNMVHIAIFSNCSYCYLIINSWLHLKLSATMMCIEQMDIKGLYHGFCLNQVLPLYIELSENIYPVEANLIHLFSPRWAVSEISVNITAKILSDMHTMVLSKNLSSRVHANILHLFPYNLNAT